MFQSIYEFDSTTVICLDPTGAPLSVKVDSRTPDSIQISWKPPEQSRQNGIITSYMLRMNSSMGNNISSADKQAIVVGLFPYTTYSVRVSAVNSVGGGPFSRAVIIATLEAGEQRYLSVNIILLMINWFFCTNISPWSTSIIIYIFEHNREQCFSFLVASSKVS